MAPYLMNHYLRKYLIKIWCVLFYRRHHTFDVKLVSNKIDTYLTSLWRHERYLFSVFRGILPAIFRRFSKKLSTSVVVHQTIFYQIIKINKTQLLLKYFFGARGVKFPEKRQENVQILQALRWRFDVWEAIVAVKNDGMSARNSYIT